MVIISCSKPVHIQTKCMMDGRVYWRFLLHSIDQFEARTVHFLTLTIISPALVFPGNTLQGKDLSEKFVWTLQEWRCGVFFSKAPPVLVLVSVKYTYLHFSEMIITASSGLSNFATFFTPLTRCHCDDLLPTLEITFRESVFHWACGACEEIYIVKEFLLFTGSSIIL